TAAALDRLRRLGVPVGCVTNADRAQQERKLEATGLTEHLPLLVTLDTFGVGKPDPRVFHEGARLLEVDPARVLYVGDEPVIDARAATEAGLRGVWLDRPGRRRGHAGEDAAARRRHGLPAIAELADLHHLLSQRRRPGAHCPRTLSSAPPFSPNADFRDPILPER